MLPQEILTVGMNVRVNCNYFTIDLKSHPLSQKDVDGKVLDGGQTAS